MVIDDPERFFRDHGVHDTWIEGVAVDWAGNTVTLIVDDLNANFRNPPMTDPPLDARPCSLHFRGVTAWRMNVKFENGLQIGQFDIHRRGGTEYDLEIVLYEGGGPGPDDWYIRAPFLSLELTE